MFNRKSTEFREDIHRLKLANEENKTLIESLSSEIKRLKLEIDDYYEKTRRLYLRLNRRDKVDEDRAHETIQQQPALEGTALRESILRRHKENV